MESIFRQRFFRWWGYMCRYCCAFKPRSSQFYTLSLQLDSSKLKMSQHSTPMSKARRTRFQIQKKILLRDRWQLCGVGRWRRYRNMRRATKRVARMMTRVAIAVRIATVIEFRTLALILIHYRGSSSWHCAFVWLKKVSPSLRCLKLLLIIQWSAVPLHDHPSSCVHVVFMFDLDSTRWHPMSGAMPQIVRPPYTRSNSMCLHTAYITGF